MTIGKTIAQLRRAKGLTQAELGEMLGVSNQAVSKWESEMTMPDVMLLPAIADVFGCSIDALFSREGEDCRCDDADLPWGEDGVIRAMVFSGRKLLQAHESPEGDIRFRIEGNAPEIFCTSSIVVEGNIIGSCTSEGNISAGGYITAGECTARGDIVAGGRIMGACIAGGDIRAAGDITGACTASGDIHAADIFGDCEDNCAPDAAGKDGDVE